MKIRMIGNMTATSSIGAQNREIFNCLLGNSLDVNLYDFNDKSIKSVFDSNDSDFNIVEVSNRPESLVSFLALPLCPTTLIVHDLWLMELLKGKRNQINMKMISKEISESLDLRPMFTDLKRIEHWMGLLGWDFNHETKQALELLGRFVVFADLVITHSQWAAKVLGGIQELLRDDLLTLQMHPTRIQFVPLPEIPPTNLDVVADLETDVMSDTTQQTPILVLGHQNSLFDTQVILEIFARAIKINPKLRLYFVGALTNQIRKTIKEDKNFKKEKIHIFEKLPGVKYKKFLESAAGFIHYRTFITEAASGTFSDIISTGKPSLVLKSGSRNDFLDVPNINWISYSTTVAKSSDMLARMNLVDDPSIVPESRISNNSYGEVVSNFFTEGMLNSNSSAYLDKIRTGYLLGFI